MIKITKKELEKIGTLAKHWRVAGNYTVSSALRRPEVKISDLKRVVEEMQPDQMKELELKIVEETVKYQGYIEREKKEAAKIAKEERKKIPSDFTYHDIPGLSKEIIGKLEAVKPENLGQAARISGMTPAALSILSVYLEKRRREKKMK